MKKMYICSLNFSWEILWEPRIHDNENQISKVLKVIYNEFKNSLERDSEKTSSNLTILTESIWWGTKG